MKKRQMKKNLKKQIFEASKVITGTCLASADPLETLREIKNQGQEFLGFDVHPVVFDAVVTRCEQVIKELINQ